MEHQIERKNTLTEADVQLIREILKDHQCRFPDITPEDMATVKMVADDFRTIKRSFLDKIVTMVLIMVLIVASFGREIKRWLAG